MHTVQQSITFDSAHLSDALRLLWAVDGTHVRYDAKTGIASLLFPDTAIGKITEACRCIDALVKPATKPAPKPAEKPAAKPKSPPKAKSPSRTSSKPATKPSKD